MSFRKNINFDDFAIIMSQVDNVAVVKKEIRDNYLLTKPGVSVTTRQHVLPGHRFALVDIPKGDLVKQYGYPFAISKGLKQGSVITKDNTKVYRPDYRKARYGSVGKVVSKKKRINSNYCENNFQGFFRGNGSVGTRNYYAIIPTSLCASDMALKLAGFFNTNTRLRQDYNNIDGVVAAAHTEGCGCNDGVIIERLMLTLKNTITHPNVGAALVIDLGCEKTNLNLTKKYLGGLDKFNKSVDFISIQSVGGTPAAFKEGKKIILKRLKKVNSVNRSAAPLKHLVIGTECGASDSFSGITANPLIGNVVDKIIHSGGSAILSEMPEMVGAESNLIGRMVSKKVVKRFMDGLSYYEDLAKKLGVNIEGNFVPGNEKGGLVNLSLKSLGAILKGGSTPIVDFIDYAQHIRHKGLSIMNGPGNDLESMSGLAASGANMILFSTGMGTTEGNLIVPVIKISTTTNLYKKMAQDMDFNAGKLIDTAMPLDQLGDGLLDLTIKVASGKKTWAEVWKKHLFQIWTAGKLSL